MPAKRFLRTARRPLSVVVLVLGTTMFFTAAAQAAKSPVNKSRFGGVAIEGYDPVAYFADAAPIKGDSAITHEWNGATWRFANPENRDRFVADPEAFAPQYGGYCAYAVSKGTTAGIDPRAWTIVDGKLYLNYSKKIQKTWEEDVPGYIAKADANWPGVIE